MVWVETSHLQKKNQDSRNFEEDSTNGSVDVHEKLPDQPWGNENGWRKTNHFIRQGHGQFGVVGHASTAPGILRQEDCGRFKATLSYIGNSRPA